MIRDDTRGQAGALTALYAVPKLLANTLRSPTMAKAADAGTYTSVVAGAAADRAVSTRAPRRRTGVLTAVHVVPLRGDRARRGVDDPVGGLDVVGGARRGAEAVRLRLRVDAVGDVAARAADVRVVVRAGREGVLVARVREPGDRGDVRVRRSHVLPDMSVGVLEGKRRVRTVARRDTGLPPSEVQISKVTARAELAVCVKPYSPKVFMVFDT